MNAGDNELVFVPLGGLGEIGMNLALYGFGPKQNRRWIMVDCGLGFAGPEQVGIDLIVPDIHFVEKIRPNLLGLIITHAHEDHIGAVADLWSAFKCRLYATPFAAGLLKLKRLSEQGAPEVPIEVVAQGSTIALDPFSIEFIPVAHSIPESCALAIRTPAGTVLHTGDWKIDPDPGLGKVTDSTRLSAIGDEGVLALVCDSTNILRDGISPSEADVAKTLREIIVASTGRVVVSTFASNVSRMRAVGLAAMAAQRDVVLVGRSMDRVAMVARECGYLEGIPEFLSMEAFPHLPRSKVVVLATGSQGERRAALARISENDHPVALNPGDTVIFSSRTIPGNEREVGRIINNFIRQNVEIITDRSALIHASGHPRRGEVAQFYDWIRPKIAVPAHGEEIHLSEHAKFATSRGIPHVIRARNGDMVLLSADAPAIIDQVPHGRLYKDGNTLLPSDDESLRMRQKLAFSGIVTIALALNDKGDLAGLPDVVFAGLPMKTRGGAALDVLIDEALFQTLDSLPRQKRRDADVVSGAIEKAVRNLVGSVWGKKPAVHVLVVEV
jgi:ribonuclease J